MAQNRVIEPETEQEKFVKIFPSYLRETFVNLYNNHAKEDNECAHKKPLAN